MPAEPACVMCPLALELGRRCLGLSPARQFPGKERCNLERQHHREAEMNTWGRQFQKNKWNEKYSYRLSQTPLALFRVRSVAKYLLSTYHVPDSAPSSGLQEWVTCASFSFTGLSCPPSAPWWPGRGKAAFKSDIHSGEKRVEMTPVPCGTAQTGRDELPQAASEPHCQGGSLLDCNPRVLNFRFCDPDKPLASSFILHQRSISPDS